MKFRGVATPTALAGVVLVAANAALSALAAGTPLTVVTARTPPVHASRVDTSGRFPQVASSRVSVTSANAALADAVIADENRYADELGRERAQLPKATRGVYRTDVNRRYLSASSTVVSALLSATREAFPGQNGGDGWLGVTVIVDAGTRVRIGDLFSNPDRGIRALAAAWKARVRASDAAPCLRTYRVAYTATAAHYDNFALTPHGLAVGLPEIEACYRLVEVIPYSTLRPYLSPSGTRLVAGTRRPL